MFVRTYFSATSLALLLALDAGAGSSSHVNLMAKVFAASDNPTGVCLGAPASLAAHSTCTSFGAFEAQPHPVVGHVRVESMACQLWGLGYLQPADTATYCVAWITDADQTPECITGASVSVAGDAGVLLATESIAQPSETVDLSSGGALVVMFSGFVDGGTADDSLLFGSCESQVRVTK